MAKKFLTLNIGASEVSLAEYEVKGSALTLLNYGLAPLAMPLDSGNADTILMPAIMDIVRAKGIKPGKVAISVSGQMAFPRFAAIPMAGSDQAKFEQLVRYEIEQNIPFPIDEMICDRQILGDTESGDKAVLIVAAKTDQIESVTSAVASAGFTPDLVGVAPISVMNALRAAKGDEGCIVMLDIGAKTTSLVIAEGEKLYNRSIPVAGNAVTKEIAQALGCTIEEAEGVKRESAYVSMGGVTEDEDETRDRISKVCRTVMTRLNAEVSRSINFYRSQQGGGTPVKLYLTGGSALMPQVADFFADALGIEVELFNPFDFVAVAPSIDQDAVAADAAMLAATSGLAVQVAGSASVAINLLPQSIIDAKAEVKRIPFVAIGSVALVAAGLCAFLAASHLVSVAETATDSIEGTYKTLDGYAKSIKAAQDAETAEAAESETLRQLLQSRSRASLRLAAVRQALKGELWIERWEGDKITIRGWKDRVDEYVKKAKDLGMKEATASEIVCARLAENPIVESANTEASRSFGKNDCIFEFVVELKFK